MPDAIERPWNWQPLEEPSRRVVDPAAEIAAHKARIGQEFAKSFRRPRPRIDRTDDKARLQNYLTGLEGNRLHKWRYEYAFTIREFRSGCNSRHELLQTTFSGSDPNSVLGITSLSFWK